MRVRPETDADTPTVREVVGAAFGGEEVPRLLDDLRCSPAWLELSFVVENDGQLLGHVSYSRGWLDTTDGPILDVLVLSPLAVVPAHQHRGVGSSLVTDSLALLASRPEPAVFLEGDPRYYRRFGFVPAHTRGVTRPSVHIPEAAFQVLPLPANQAPLRGALVYPDVFWRHGAVGLRR